MSLLSEVIRAALGFQGVGDGGSVSAPADLLEKVSKDAVGAVLLLNPLNDGWFNMYAQHRSHSSHSSHRSHSSHSSHYSSSGGGSYRPAYTPPPPPPPPAPAPATKPAPAPQTVYTPPTAQKNSSPSTPKPSTDELKSMIMRVQAALFARGYDPGAIDGVLTEQTKGALKKFQTTHGLVATGTMTTETLTALNISLR